MTKFLPKAELHCHIEGAAPVSLATKQAAKYNMDISDIIDGDHYRWRDFTSFLKAYDTVAKLFKSEEDYAALAESYLSEIAAAGAIYCEIFVSPDHAKTAGLSPQSYLEGLAKGMMCAEQTCGIVSRMIIIGVRHLGPDAVEQAAKFAASRPHDLVTGFGMAGDERIGNLSDYARAFDIARDARLGLTVHAGELVGWTSVQDAVDCIRPSRIGHGVRAIENDALVDRLAGEQIVLEVCPGSNIALDVYPTLGEHPFRKLHEAGVCLTISSDDPPYFKTSLAQEYQNIEDTFGFGEQDMLQFTRNALDAAFVDKDTRAELLAKL